MTQTYASYLCLDELLKAQRPVSDGPEHDETLFIIIHQVYELWFKQVLHEADHLVAALQAGDTPTVLHTLKRILTILKTLVVQVDVLETMTPLSFMSFRDRLQSSSGFQSGQFRELEALLGSRDPKVLSHFAADDPQRARIQARYRAPGLWQAFLRYLQRAGHSIPDAEVDAVPPAPVESEALQAVLLEVYRSHPINSQVCERMVDLDEGIQEWRYRHVKMVERTIGTKGGTGGSAGVAYLRQTLFRPAFPDLWAIRGQL